MKQTYKLIFIALLLGLCVSGVQANAFSAWSAYGDGWRATNDTYTIIMYNQTGTHYWLSTGNSSSVDYLVVAGGGSGGFAGAKGAGGGGAGGFLAGTGFPVSGTQTVIVGAGGGAVTSIGAGNDGGNSQFGSATSIGGGGGGYASNGRTGGSGGGASAAASSSIGGAGNASQGNNGGNATSDDYWVGAGGGGAGGVGGNATASGHVGGSAIGGNGGSGLSSSITGLPVSYAAGGGGGAETRVSTHTQGIGGSGIGGNAGVTSGTSGVANTGSGGGSGGSVSSGAGGSGIVIIQYLTPLSITADFTASNTSGIQPLYVQFTDTSTTTDATIDAWNWSFDDGGISVLQNPDHTFINAGTYNINLTITNTSHSLVSTKIQTVIVYSLPTIEDHDPVVVTNPYYVVYMWKRTA